MELDFLIRYRNECVPVECKARSGNAKSMKTVPAHPEKYHVFNAIKLGDIGRSDKTLAIPWCMAFLLNEKAIYTI